MKLTLHSLIPFLPLFYNCQLNSIPLLSSSYPGRLASRNSILFFSTELFFFNQFAGTTQKTQPLYYWEGVITTPLHSNGNYSIVACVFCAAGMCLPSRCLIMDVSYDFIIPDFGRHVTIRNVSIHIFNICF
jgi:hypothetical protein